MKYLKKFESINLPDYHKEGAEKYLEELEISLDDLNDIFSEIVDSKFEIYLQLFYIGLEGKRWINNTTDKIEKGAKLHPCLSLRFRKESESLKSDFKSSFGSTHYSEDTDITKSFLFSVDRLKSMFPKKEILWNWSKGDGYIGGEVCIYFDEIIKSS